MLPNAAADHDRTEEETRMQGLLERIDQLEGENKTLREAILRNSRMFEALLRNGSEGITLTGPDRRIVRVVKGLTGIDPVSFSGRLIESLAVPEDREIVVRAYHGLLEGQYRKTTILVRVPRADGSIIRHMATLTDMLDDPNVQGIVWNYSA
jgi:PAS domain-containing protein